MDRVGWHKSMAHFPSICYSYLLNPQVLFYDVHGIHFDYRTSNILWKQNINSFIIKPGDYVHDHPNNNGPNTKLNNMYGNARMKNMKHHGTLKFSLPRMNSTLVETWGAFELSHTKITQKSPNKTPPPCSN